jgi:hypothetical protein
MTMISCGLYRCLLEEDLVPPLPRGHTSDPQSAWLREDNLNWLYARDIHYPSLITALEAKEMVQRYMHLRKKAKVINKPRNQITGRKIRELVSRM